MRPQPTIKQFVPVLCLLLAGAFAAASGATPTTTKSSSTTRTHHRSRGVSAWGDPTKDDNAEYDDPV
ncbi:MAG: hypothetical protein WCA15_08355, partial [Candidatus Acidiferrales bacterium]